MSNVINFLDFSKISFKIIVDLLWKSPRKVTFCMPIRYFSPSVSLLFSHQKVTNWKVICTSKWWEQLSGDNQLWQVVLLERHHVWVFRMVSLNHIECVVTSFKNESEVHQVVKNCLCGYSLERRLEEAYCEGSQRIFHQKNELPGAGYKRWG